MRGRKRRGNSVMVYYDRDCRLYCSQHFSFASTRAPCLSFPCSPFTRFYSYYCHLREGRIFSGRCVCTVDVATLSLTPEIGLSFLFVTGKPTDTHTHTHEHTRIGGANFPHLQSRVLHPPADDDDDVANADIFLNKQCAPDLKMPKRRRSGIRRLRSARIHIVYSPPFRL